MTHYQCYVYMTDDSFDNRDTHTLDFIRKYRYVAFLLTKYLILLHEYPAGGQDWAPVRGVLYEPGSEIFSQSQVQSNFAVPDKLAHEAMIQNSPSCQIFAPNEFDSYLSLIKFAGTT